MEFSEQSKQNKVSFLFLHVLKANALCKAKKDKI